MKTQFQFNNFKVLSITIVTLLFTQCKIQDMQVKVTYPPHVILPENVKRITVINASLIDKTEHQVNKAEGVLSGEALNGDKLGSEDCIRAFSDVLNGAQLQTVIPQKHTETKKITQGVPFMDRALINKYCRENNSEALAVLEFFDTNTDAIASNVGTVTNILATGNLNPAPVNYRINYQFRLYDTLSNSVIDDYQNIFSAVFQPALPFEPLPTKLVRKNGTDIGRTYAGHYLPTYYWQPRELYKKGNSDFAVAARKASTNDWEGAVELWRKNTYSKDETIAGRACYNMALGCEVLGNIPAAKEWAQKAYVNYGLKKGRDYLNILENLPQ